MRLGTVKRDTRETQITVTVDLDGNGVNRIDTGIGFFDHMLTALAVHSGIDMNISVNGDLHVDCHHTIEDTGIALGGAIAKALGDKAGICRYGSMFIPMDESLGFVSLDISGRPYLVFDCNFVTDKMGEMDTQMVEEFFRAFAFHAGITLHAKLCYGTNDHHKSEALFKALAHSLKQAVKRTESDTPLSTKGVLEF
ncbi:MAG: imidazoleglycerol-phosphate dehydratase HisB [Oscillospiraceae bacterium]|nr:imidazoleglycerol-phosphate dehydratase HisB [Oscillospiraceae bacterium]